MKLKEIAVTVAATLVVALLFFAKELPVAETGEEFDRNRLIYTGCMSGMFVLLSLCALAKYTNSIIKFCLFLLIGCNLFTGWKMLLGTAGEPRYSDYTFLFGIALFSFCLAFRKAGKSAANNLYMRWHQQKKNKTYGKGDL